MNKYVALLVVLTACGGATEPKQNPQSNARSYVLTNLLYEDVIPGSYALRLSDSTFQGGPAVMAFADSGRGALSVATPLTALLQAVPESLSQGRVLVLKAAVDSFTYTADSATGIVVFNLQGWPFDGAYLNDSVYYADNQSCFNTDCTNYVRLAFRWNRSR